MTLRRLFSKRHHSVLAMLILLVCVPDRAIAVEGAETGGERARLRDMALQDPMNAEVIEQLVACKAEEDKRRQKALTFLVEGLILFKQGAFRKAGFRLRGPTGHSYIENTIQATVADKRLLPKIFRTCDKFKNRTSCRMCDKTGLECCPNCKGVSGIVCRQCKGSGKQGQVSRSNFGTNPCPICDMYEMEIRVSRSRRSRKDPDKALMYEPDSYRYTSGLLECPHCHGSGVAPCKVCHQLVAGVLYADDYIAIDTLLGVVSYLNNGGLDFFTEGALRPLKCTPKGHPAQ